jgi:4-nitrophenyl phosphatase
MRDAEGRSFEPVSVLSGAAKGFGMNSISTHVETAPETPVAISAAEPNAYARLRAAKAWIFDMDGVLYRGAEPLPGVADLFAALELRERPFMLATNNSMSTAEEYVKKLETMGISVPASAILTSAVATRDYLAEAFGDDLSILVIGMPSLKDQLFHGTGFHDMAFPHDVPDAVVIGLDKAFTYEKLSAANAAIRAGARFVATNTDATLPTESGLIPGAGSIIAAVATATGQDPVVVGKPEPLMLHMALQRMGVLPHEAVMVGDRLDTDIVAGDRAGMLTVLVLTGVSTRGEIATAPSLPDLVFTDLNAITESLTLDDV